MDPLVSLYYYAPVCAVINFVLMLLWEGVEPFYQLDKLGAFVLFSNAGIAFALNVSRPPYVCPTLPLICSDNWGCIHDQVAAVFLIAVGSGLILTLAGVLKDIVSPQCLNLFTSINHSHLPCSIHAHTHSFSFPDPSSSLVQPLPWSKSLDIRSPCPDSSCSRRVVAKSRERASDTECINVHIDRFSPF